MKSIHTQFDAVVRAKPRETVRMIRRLDEELLRERCSFGDRVIPCFAKPFFLSEKETQELRKVLGIISQMHTVPAGTVFIRHARHGILHPGVSQTR